MAAKTTSLANSVLDRVLKNNAQFAYAWPATVYLALFTADPTTAGLFTGEVTPAEYVRQAVTWGTIAGGSVSNSAGITFSVAINSWGNIGWAGIVDAQTGGSPSVTMLYQGTLAVPKIVGIGDQVSFAVGAVVANES
jgi:hypothetical protein